MRSGVVMGDVRGDLCSRKVTGMGRCPASKHAGDLPTITRTIPPSPFPLDSNEKTFALGSAFSGWFCVCFLPPGPYASKALWEGKGVSEVE